MANLLGTKNHLTGVSTGNAPGATKSRLTQGDGIPKIRTKASVPRSVDGPKSYGIRHASVGSVSKIPKTKSGLNIPKAMKPPKLGTEL